MQGVANNASSESGVSGVFSSGVHPTSGTVVIDDSFLHIKNLKSDPGPDLFAYLSKDKTVGDAVNLGALKSTTGDQSYAIPADVDVEEYAQVLIWCRAFGVLFGSAKLQ